MSLINVMLSREESRNKNMLAEYMKELRLLPKGSIKPKKVNNKTYYYLTFREGNKIITKYVGKDEKTLVLITQQLERRKQIEQIIKQLKKEREQIKKMEALL